MKVGERLLITRKYLNLTQTQFAAPLGVNRGYIAILETTDKEPSDTLLKLISYEYGISYTWLKTGDGEMFVPPEKYLKDQMIRFDKKAIIKAFNNLMNNRNPGSTTDQLTHLNTGDADLDRMVNALYELWATGDERLKNWASIQFDMAFPKHIIETIMNKRTAK